MPCVTTHLLVYLLHILLYTVAPVKRRVQSRTRTVRLDSLTVSIHGTLTASSYERSLYLERQRWGKLPTAARSCTRCSKGSRRQSTPRLSGSCRNNAVPRSARSHGMAPRSLLTKGERTWPLLPWILIGC